MSTSISVFAITKADKIRAAKEVARLCAESGEDTPPWAAHIVFEHGINVAEDGMAEINLCSSEAAEYDGSGDYEIDLEKLGAEWPGCKKLVVRLSR